MNIVVLKGNLTRDPVLSYTPSQMAMCKFGMAINKKYKDKETTCFIDAVSFGKTGETISKYLKKGSQILISGELSYQSWQAQDGTNRSKIEVLVNSFEFLDSKDVRAPQETTQVPDFNPDIDDSEIPF
jgi:single-strand DNA-binding protein